MHVLSWNLSQRRAIPALGPLLATHRPQLVMLQEGDRPPEWSSAAVGRTVPGQRWGSWLLANEGTLTPIAMPDYAGWLTGATWSSGSQSVACFSLHSPSGTDNSYIAECLSMVGVIESVVTHDMPVVIGGDFNFVSLGRRAAGEALGNTAAELEALNDFHARGFTLAWRSAHPSAPLAQTLRWSRNPATPYHCDGFLVRGLSVTGCEVLSTEALGFPSDHEPVVVQLAPTQAA